MHFEDLFEQLDNPPDFIKDDWAALWGWEKAREMIYKDPYIAGVRWMRNKGPVPTIPVEERNPT